MTVVCPWEFGKELFLKTDPDQRPRILTGVMFRPGGTMFELVFGSASSWHYEFEITEKQDILTKATA